jgi:hypothetical protein
MTSVGRSFHRFRCVVVDDFRDSLDRLQVPVPAIGDVRHGLPRRDEAPRFEHVVDLSAASPVPPDRRAPAPSGVYPPPLGRKADHAPSSIWVAPPRATTMSSRRWEGSATDAHNCPSSRAGTSSSSDPTDDILGGLDKDLAVDAIDGYGRSLLVFFIGWWRGQGAAPPGSVSLLRHCRAPGCGRARRL